MKKPVAAIADFVIGQAVGATAYGEKFARWIHRFFAVKE